jgi:hypothetical protein
MAGGDRSAANATLAAALACGVTVEQAAVEAKVSESTVYRRLRSPKFRAKVARLRRQAAQEAAGKLAALGGEAVDKLADLVRSSPDNVTLAAIRTTLEYLFKSSETAGLAGQVEELERRLAAVEKAAGEPAQQPDADGHHHTNGHMAETLCRN